jgi:hypothetical protein
MECSNSFARAGHNPTSSHPALGSSYVGCSEFRSVASASATPAQVSEAVQINVDARLKALKMVLLLIVGHGSAVRLPGPLAAYYLPGAVPGNPLVRS